MSMEKIAALNKVAREMEEMKKKVVGETITDKNKLRVEALKKIQEYLKEVSKATERFYFSARAPFTIYWLVKQSEIDQEKSFGVTFTFKSNGTVDISQNSYGSYLRIDNFTNKAEKDFYYTCSDGSIQWNHGYVELINNWHNIKPYIEKEAETELLKYMAKTQKELNKFKTEYEILNDFEA